MDEGLSDEDFQLIQTGKIFYDDFVVYVCIRWQQGLSDRFKESSAFISVFRQDSGNFEEGVPSELAFLPHGEFL